MKVVQGNAVLNLIDIFFIRYKYNNTDKEEGAGWASEGMIAANAAELLSIFKSNIRKGERPQSLFEMREI